MESDDTIAEIFISVFGPSTYRESTYGLIFERQGTELGRCIGYSTDRNCWTGTIKPLTSQLIALCDKLNIIR